MIQGPNHARENGVFNASSTIHVVCDVHLRQMQLSLIILLCLGTNFNSTTGRLLPRLNPYNEKRLPAIFVRIAQELTCETYM